MTGSFAELLAEDRRLVILRALAEVPGAQLNESTIKQGLAFFGHQVGRDIVRADLQWLEEHRLVRVEKLVPASGELWLAHLTEAGDEVRQGRPHAGVARPTPR